MSKSIARSHREWEVVLAKLSRVSVCFQGIPLSDQDAATFTEAIVMCCLLLTDLSLQYEDIGDRREIVAWAHVVCSLDVHDLASFLSDALVSIRSVSKPIAPEEFKRSLGSRYPFAGAYFSPVRRILASFLADPNPRDFYILSQLLSFLTHVTLVDISTDVVSGYKKFEQQLSLRGPVSYLTRELNEIMKEWMLGFSITEESFVPRHGPGAVAERLAMEQRQLEKFRHVGTDQLVTYVFAKYADLDVTTFFPFSPPPEGPCPWVQKAGFKENRTSVLVTVPKSIKTRRTISKEPAWLQFLQQAVRRALYSHVEGAPALRSHIDFHNQAPSAKLAIASSETGSYATIDLSAASDSVTVQLVKAVFHGTKVYPFLLALRSYFVDVEGEVIRMEKYAPMGSALCFPVQTLIFAAIVELAGRRAHRTGLRGYPNGWRVFGDDIIVADDLYGDVCLILETVGFTINSTKSYASPARFREACGGEGFDGRDVTPMRLSRRFRSIRLGSAPCLAADYEGLRDLANLASSYEFSLLRSWIVRSILTVSPTPPLFSSDGKGAVYSVMPDNYRARRRYARAYQRQEVEVLVSRQKKVKDKNLLPDLEIARYHLTLRMISLRGCDFDRFDPDQLVQIPRGSGKSVLRKTWEPTRDWEAYGDFLSLIPRFERATRVGHENKVGGPDYSILE